jgi:hypothetical protein
VAGGVVDGVVEVPAPNQSLVKASMIKMTRRIIARPTTTGAGPAWRISLLLARRRPVTGVSVMVRGRLASANSLLVESDRLPASQTHLRAKARGGGDDARLNERKLPQAVLRGREQGLRPPVPRLGFGPTTC